MVNGFNPLAQSVLHMEEWVPSSGWEDLASLGGLIGISPYTKGYFSGKSGSAKNFGAAERGVS